MGSYSLFPMYYKRLTHVSNNSFFPYESLGLCANNSIIMRPCVAMNSL